MLAGRRRVDELLRECVAAVQDARQEGSGRVAMFQSLGARSHTAGGLVGRLRQGLRDGEVRVFYQPVVDLGTRDVVGVEALVRWEHPEYGLLTAEEFIEAAETDDLIHDLGAFVLSEACRQVARWPGPPLDLAVNVSARQLSERSLARTVQECLDASGLAPERLVLEITETALMQDLATALDVLAECRDSGVRVSLDDFGTGFAGFGYLRELPVDEVKIDRSFVTGLTANTFDTAIVTGIVEMARGLGLQTTGEGVETPRQAHVLTALGCDRAQGHLWSPAAPGSGRVPVVAGHPVPPRQRSSL
jgi:EAL domain-containing protein (putative c-di-GMP-specific phosphodiesterase class I)